MSDPRGIISPPPVGGVRVEGTTPLRRVDRRRGGPEDEREREERRRKQGRILPEPPDDGQPHVDVLA